MAQSQSPTIILEGLENINVPDLSHSVRFTRVNYQSAPEQLSEGNNISMSQRLMNVTEPVEEGSALSYSAQSELSA